MKSCTSCPVDNTNKDSFKHIGKTYYIMPDLSILCFRHWHQANRPKYLYYGEHMPVQQKVLELQRSLAKNGTIEPVITEHTTEIVEKVRGNYQQKKSQVNRSALDLII